MRFTKALVAATALIGVALTGRASAQAAGGRFVAGEIIVKFRPDTDTNAKADAHRNGRGTETAEIRRTNVQRVRVGAGD